MNDQDNQNFNIHMMQPNMGSQITTHGSVHGPIMNFPPIQRPNVMMAGVVNPEDHGFNNFNRMQPHVNIASPRPPNNNNNFVVYANTNVRPQGGFYASANPLMSSNMPNTYYVNPNANMLQPGMQPVRINRPVVSSQPPYQIANVRPAGAMNLTNQMMRHPQIYMMSQPMQGPNGQVMPHYFATPNPISIEQPEMLNVMQSMAPMGVPVAGPIGGHMGATVATPLVGNIAIPAGNMWSQNQPMQIQQVNQANQSIQMDRLPPGQGFHVQFLNQPPQPFIPHNAQVQPMRTVSAATQPNFERSNSQPQPNVAQAQQISRPISDISRPSTIHYHPQGEKHLTVPEVKPIATNSQKVQYENQYEASPSLNEGYVLPELVNSNSPTRNGLKSSNSGVMNTPTIVRLCNPIPTCDSEPSRHLIDDAIINIKNDVEILSNIPGSTFVEIVIPKKPNDYEFSTSTKFLIRESVYSNIASRAHIDIQMKCVMDDTSCINHWPPKYSLRLNGKTVDPVKQEFLIGDEAILIKNYLHQLENTLEVSCTVPGDSGIEESDGSEPVMAFKITVNLVLRSLTSVMTRAIVNKRTQSVRKSLDFVQQFFTSNTMELARGYTVISILDPVTKKPMNIPVRGEHCKHIQCFDFESLCARHVNRTHFVCPVCRIPCSLPGVIVDGYMCTLVVQMRQVGNKHDIKLTPEGNWCHLSPQRYETVQPSLTSPSKTTSMGTGVYAGTYASMGDLFTLFGPEKQAALQDFFDQAKRDISLCHPQNNGSAKAKPDLVDDILGSPGSRKRPYKKAESESTPTAVVNEEPSSQKETERPVFSIVASPQMSPTPYKPLELSDDEFGPMHFEATDGLLDRSQPSFQRQDVNFNLNSTIEDSSSTIFNFGSNDLFADTRPNASLGFSQNNHNNVVNAGNTTPIPWDFIDDDFLKEVSPHL
ncbi:Zinc finger MIZ domain-containing protein 2 [Thelohanellus kitauei]|uniref:Zinc finger MIZ domain-containing protein 2 n=1 Tax=Thelohanellus kitauei TaxID=669202 RepID=A0A0C2JUV3_THEKT|nr:Zinc finger MIZ domain-containing protein 2 [Thelohanellus kitauei]